MILQCQEYYYMVDNKSCINTHIQGVNCDITESKFIFKVEILSEINKEIKILMINFYLKYAFTFSCIAIINL